MMLPFPTIKITLSGLLSIFFLKFLFYLLLGFCQGHLTIPAAAACAAASILIYSHAHDVGGYSVP